MRVLVLIIFICVSLVSTAQKQSDLAALKNLCGCFEVDFKYAETFSPIKDYKFHDRYTAKAVELALPLVMEDDQVIIQHLLVLNDTMVIKHWREDWLFENQNLLAFEGDSRWTKTNANAPGTWTQKVFGTTDEPRYEGTATWTHVDGVSQWFNVAASPLPRREYTKRKDYNIMMRGNRIVINENGYTHEQDNDKINRIGEERTLIASEKGYNIYTKIEDSKCKAGMDWWEKNAAFWGDVQKAWSDVLEKQPKTFEMKEFSRTKLMYEALAELQEQNLSSEENYQKAIKVLQGFLKESTPDLVGKVGK